MEFFLLSCATIDAGGGVYRYQLSETGETQRLGYFPCDRPMYAVKGENKLCVLLRAPFGNDESGYFELDCDLNENSATKLQGTHGVCACHLAVEGTDNYVVNYLSGNLVKNCRTERKHEGWGVHPKRQEAPHTHFVGLSPDKKYVLCCDLGLDTLFVYDRDLAPVAAAKVPAGYGIRHFVLSKDGDYIYAINELVPSVSVFAYDGGNLRYVKTVEIPVEDKTSTAAAIRLSADGKNLYCSVRGENALYVFSVDKDGLTLKQKRSCEGKGPRDIYLLADRYLVSCNENSDNATIFALDGADIGEKIGEIDGCKGVLCCLDR